MTKQTKKIIQCIEINIGDKTVKVSVQEARAVCDALTSLLGRSPYTPYTWNHHEPLTDTGNITTTGTSPFARLTGQAR